MYPTMFVVLAHREGCGTVALRIFPPHMREAAYAHAQAFMDNNPGAIAFVESAIVEKAL
jgi:hypothetical protein